MTTPTETAASAAANGVQVVPVALAGRSYEIRIGSGLLAGAGAAIAPYVSGGRTAVVTDSTVADLHLPALTASLKAAGIDAETVVLPPGEASKSFAGLERLCSRLLDAGIERGGAVIALGGGVVGDLAGFAAAILRRGVEAVQIPTTLLAQVDSSVGGKTGINMPQGKNLVGAFHQPRLVLIDPATLDTLPQRDLRAGYAEVVKYGLIDRPDFFAWLETHGAALLAGDSKARREAIATCCRAKAEIVAGDERESGQRALLNLGHTFGHALEGAAGYDGSLLHGEAVAVGCVMAMDLSVALGLAPAGDAARLRRHLMSMDLPVSARFLSPVPDPDTLLCHMRQDKKMREGRLTFVLTRGIGRAFLTDEVPEDSLRALLERVCSEKAELS